METNNQINGNRIGYKLKGWAYWVSKNEDGTLTVSNDGVTLIKNTGSLIVAMGGVDATLSACDKEPITADDFRKQFSLAKESEGYAIPYTKKQLNEVYYVG